MRLLPLGLAAVYAADAEAGSGKLAKVIQMLDAMMMEGRKQMETEQVQWSKRAQWCVSTKDRLADQIEEGESDKKSQKATIESAEANAGNLKEGIEELNGQVTEAEGKIAKMRKTRAEENKLFLEEQLDLEKSLAALQKAIGIVTRKQAQKGGDVQALLQDVPDRAQKLAFAFMGDQREYQSKSGGVVGMLEKLEEDFKKQLHEMRTTELNRKQNFELNAESLKNQITNWQSEIQDKSGYMQEQNATAAAAKKDLAATESSLKDDSSELRDTKVVCAEEEKTFNSRQQVFKDELAAQQQATKILREVGGSFIQTSFLQVSTGQIGDAKVAIYLEKQSKKLGSQILAQVASRIAEDPFVKVRGMIEKMINKLLDEGDAAAKLKAFCEPNMKKNKLRRAKLYQKREKYTSEEAGKKAEHDELMAAVKKLKAEVAGMAKALKEASDMRADEKKDNLALIQEAQEGQQALAKAIDVLNNFYAKNSFMQVPVGSPEWNQLPPAETPEPVPGQEQKKERSFGGQGADKAGGVMALLELILSDFANEEAAVTQQEAEAASEFDRLTQETKKNTAKKNKTAELKTQAAKEAINASKAAAESLYNTGREIKTAEEEWVALKPQCPQEYGGTKDVVTHEERMAKRQEEIDSLKEALELLKA